MRFAYPQMVWLLLVTVILLTWFLWWAWRRKQQLVAQFVQSRLLAQLTVGVSPTRQKIRLSLLVVAVTCAILTLSRPQWGFVDEQATQRGLDIVVAIDTSRSMLAEDVRPNRLARAKFAAIDLMKISKSDRLGLVAFAGDAFLQCPLTLDEEAFRQSLEALDVGIISQGGTALTTAIETALTAFKSEGDNYKILVLFTDGEDHESDAVQTAKKAAKAGLRIFTIGVGTPNGELLRVTDENGVAAYVKDAQGNAVKSRLREDLLQEIATETSGFYLPLRMEKTIETLYEKGLAPLPKGEISSRQIRQYHERFQWPLALAIVLLLAEMLLPERKRVPRSEAIALAPNTGLRKAVALLLFIAMGLPAYASPRQALQKYEAGQFQDAQKEYQTLLQKKPDDARLHYNAGTAAYRAKRYTEAAKSFGEALTAPDLQLQQHAFFNLGDTLYRLGEETTKLNQKISHWEKSVKQFEGALSLNPSDADAKHNLDFVKKKLQELKKQQQKNQPDDIKPSEAEKQAKARADEAVRRQEYSKALEIMETQLKIDPSTRAYSDYMERLKEVKGVQTIDQH
jgi:Ca-activated chloride channel family protein